MNVISHIKTGWSLRDIREMTVRQRRYWAKTALWELERRATLNG